ncbi:nucleotidyltransferase domain-containing protein [Haliangium ochraceum]|uniref:DNA polymerase beta domain protein region n=1 Tax=Haliangium ochraceum (strain DSM 14365 / JCM 11303 / SMP-2) TaxID=502025 RepID=D0LVR4_HALO1|nr:nucleotidyltransferase domain-containing protein [Haliangium ochraceum]ACY14048.1 DNA polymerase beta domain protein region [Haliangium ochraceum DSM 14365]
MTTLSSLPARHRSFADDFIAAVRQDPRIRALLAGGSLVHGGFDELSDLDFVVVVEDAEYDALLGDRAAFARALGPLLSAFTGEHVGEPRLLICLYGPPLLHVDLKFVRERDLARMVERPAVLFARDPAALEARLASATIAWPERPPQWFEDRAWTWLHYAATKHLRGEFFEAIGMLALFRDQLLGPMLHRHAGRPQRGARRLESSSPEAAARLRATLAGHDAGSLADAIEAAIDLYLALREDAPPERPVPHMPAALRAFARAGD